MWEEKGGQGRWRRLVNTETGESSIKTHRLKVVKQWCPEEGHYFVLVDSSKRLCVCNKCGWETAFIVGLQQLTDGKIISKN